MCNCSSSFFLSLPFLDARVARPSSENPRWRLRRIGHSMISFSAFDSDIFAFPGKFKLNEKSSSKFVSRLRASISNDEEVVHNKVEPSSSDFMENNSVEFPRDGDLIRLENGNDTRDITGSRGIKQTMTRSNLIAKQVITIQSALGLGFISQLWVDTTSWLVLVVDVKPSLLSGESERLLFKDIVRVGDVVLVDNETVLDTEFKMVGLETLVGYRVVTPRGRNIGKVRGYSFNINSGIVESIELDAFGVTVLPSSLVSTYRLDVEDIIEVFEDIVVVHEAAASRKQRLTKGLWDTQFGGDYSDAEELESSSDRRQRRSKRSSRKKRDLDNEEWDIFR